MELLSAELTPETGLYNIPADAYRALPYVNNSGLSQLRKSPAHLRWALDNPSHKTPALLLGEAAHYAILEPVAFDLRYACSPGFDRRTTAGKQAFASWAKENEGKTILSPDDFCTVKEMAFSVLSHPSAGALLGADRETEVTAIWQDSATGLMCKGRIDAISTEFSAPVDVKTTEDASRHAFERSIFKFGYHRQAAFYLDGLRACGRDYDHFVFVCVEKSPPYSVAIYRLFEDSLELGRKEIRQLLNLYKKCSESGEWPGYPDHVQDVSLPAWAVKQTQEDIRYE